jgi:hypothetical protein
MLDWAGLALAVARREARAQVSSGHLLLGALHPDGGDLIRRRNLKVDLDAIRERVGRLTAGPADPHARLSDRVKQALTEHRNVEDAVAALLADPESTASRALAQAGVDLSAFQRPKRTKVARQLKYGYHPPGV